MIQVQQRDEISVQALGLEYTGIDAEVSAVGLITISYDTFESSQLTMSEAYEISNLNVQGLHMKLTPFEPTSDMSQVDFYCSSIDGIEFLRYESGVWTTDYFGLVNGATGMVSLELHTLTGSDPIVLDVTFDMELVMDSPWLEEIWQFVTAGSANAQFIATSTELGNWIGAFSSDKTIDYVFCNCTAGYIQSTSVSGDNILEFNGDADFLATWTDINGFFAFDLHVQETDELIRVLP